MRVTSLGHAGMFVETVDGSIVCDPWFLPAFFGSWCVFPRNDQLSDDLRARVHDADYLYITHLHADHFDEAWLDPQADNLRRDITVLLPDYPTRELENRLRKLGFFQLIRTVDATELALGEHVSIAIHVETSITDGPGGDSAMVVSETTASGTTRLVNQNDCRTDDLAALRGHGPVDLHWIQYSGAIWYPMVYDESPVRMRELVDAKVASQYSRAMRYVEAIDASAVVPSAGPPCFLDPDLFHLNVITGDELSIFPDQRGFLDQLAAAGHRGLLAIPGTLFDLLPGVPPQPIHPLPEADVAAIFDDKLGYLQRYQADWAPYLRDRRAMWAQTNTDLLATLQAWWQPLMAMAPTLCSAVGDRCVLHFDDESSLAVIVDFPAGVVRAYRPDHPDDDHGFSFRIDRALVETIVAERAVDWSNALFLSCRFSAWRRGAFNEYLYNFFKSLSVIRMRRAEAEALHRLDPERDGLSSQEFELGDYLIERTCPHRQADLTVFGELDDERNQLVCTLHGWRFDLDTGRCITAQDRPLKVRRRGGAPPS
jgi:UDP-MurNAc hydroxylase